MYGVQTLEILLEARRQTGVEGISRAEERVAARRRDGDPLERGRAWRLQLVRDVGVPELEFRKGGWVGTPRGVIVYNWDM